MPTGRHRQPLSNQLVGERNFYMANLRSTLDGLDKIIKILLVLFFDPIYGGLYRLAPCTGKAIVLGILWWITGGLFGIGWIIDLVHIITKGSPSILVD